MGKSQNGVKYLWVLSTYIIYPMGAWARTSEVGAYTPVSSECNWHNNNNDDDDDDDDDDEFLTHMLSNA